MSSCICRCAPMPTRTHLDPAGLSASSVPPHPLISLVKRKGKNSAASGLCLEALLPSGAGFGNGPIRRSVDRRDGAKVARARPPGPQGTAAVGADSGSPGRFSMAGNVPFLMKDVVLLAASVYLLKQDV